MTIFRNYSHQGIKSWYSILFYKALFPKCKWVKRGKGAKNFLSRSRQVFHRWSQLKSRGKSQCRHSNWDYTVFSFKPNSFHLSSLLPAMEPTAILDLSLLIYQLMMYDLIFIFLLQNLPCNPCSMMTGLHNLGLHNFALDGIFPHLEDHGFPSQCSQH